MNVKPKFVYYDIRRKQSVSLIMYTHENDVDTQVLEVSMLDNGEPLVDTPVSPIYDNGAGVDKVITTAAFIRVIFYDKSGQGENLIVTINEVI